MADSQAFLQLDPRIQAYLWSEGWGALRDVQERAIPVILRGDRDAVLAASTASGKTEAAFLPALTSMLARPEPSLIVYISPLKALINDQFGRLERLCERLEIPVWPWHGDVTASRKQKFFKEPHGVLLITPESLEALFCNRGSRVAGIFGDARFVVVDELHAFIGTERGKQLQSLLHRIDEVLGRPVPRIGLSATLGDMQLAARFLRANQPVEIIDSRSGGGQLRVLVRGFEEPMAPSEDADTPGEPPDPVAPKAIAEHLFAALRGSSNLVFPNSRREVERYTHLLREQCAAAKVPNEFWPHHGNLSKEIRHDTELALKQREQPATAICTSTLELGIDIGAVKSVAQIGTPPSVASLRQRLGRSGRRDGEPAILRGFVIEEALGSNSDLATRLRIDTVQMAATISLLLANWFEPPVTHGAHHSTLVQQLVSLIAQTGGLTAGRAYYALCAPGAPFAGMSKAEFADFLRTLGQHDVLVQDSAGTLLHGPLGDRMVNHYSFYAAFATDEEFRIVVEGKTLGTLPVAQMLSPGQRILFGGRTWLVESVDDASKTVHVAAARGGAPPLFSGGVGQVHSRVRQTMCELYQGVGTIPFLDATANRFLEEGRGGFKTLGLERTVLIDQGAHVQLVTWEGDAVNEAIARWLTSRDVRSYANRLGVEVERAERSVRELTETICDVAKLPIPEVETLLHDAANLTREKWDHLLSPSLLRRSYASLHLDIEGAERWLARHFGQSTP
ncbi:DEAD/DEAH box helicase [Lysobacter xanthus]